MVDKIVFANDKTFKKEKINFLVVVISDFQIWIKPVTVVKPFVIAGRLIIALFTPSIFLNIPKLNPFAGELEVAPICSQTYLIGPSFKSSAKSENPVIIPVAVSIALAATSNCSILSEAV